MGADFQAPQSFNSFSRSISSYTACPIVASKLGLPPSSDVVVALAALLDVLGMPAAETIVVISFHAGLTKANLGGFLPSPYNATSQSFMALTRTLVSSAVKRSWRVPGKSAFIIAIHRGTSMPAFKENVR